MGHPLNPQMWYFYFNRKNHQSAISYFNDCLDTWCKELDEDKPCITATPSHIIVKTIVDEVLYGDCGECEESEIWYSQCDFVETSECTRIYNPNKD